MSRLYLSELEIESCMASRLLSVENKATFRELIRCGLDAMLQQGKTLEQEAVPVERLIGLELRQGFYELGRRKK